MRGMDGWVRGQAGGTRPSRCHSGCSSPPQHPLHYIDSTPFSPEAIAHRLCGTEDILHSAARSPISNLLNYCSTLWSQSPDYFFSHGWEKRKHSRQWLEYDLLKTVTFQTLAYLMISPRRILGQLRTTHAKWLPGAIWWSNIWSETTLELVPMSMKDAEGFKLMP